MAVYLRLPPGSEGTSVPAGQPMSPPMPAGANGAAGRWRRPQLRLPASGLGYLNLPMARPWALGDSGKCSPAVLGSAVASASGPGRVGSWFNP